jgi:hypothetical protein
MVDRRTVNSGLIGLGAASAFGSTPGAAAAKSPVVQGETTWSESAMVLYFDPEVRNGFSFRISRYPDKDATWVWCHVLVDGVLYAFTDSTAACASAHTSPDAPLAVYDAPGLKVSIGRLGTSADTQAISFSADVRAWRGRSGTDGPGDTQISLEGVFHPGPLHAGQPAGRFERNGMVEATLSAGGKAMQLGGLGKAHEQTQTGPRFTTPFTYAMLWGPSASMIGLLSPAGGFGDYNADGQDRGVASFKIEAWAPTRRFIATLKDGTRVEGAAETVQRYEVPIFGQHWQGRIVRAVVGGHETVGMINDWREGDLPYGLT